jgi:hypothetical protein
VSGIAPTAGQAEAFARSCGLIYSALGHQAQALLSNAMAGLDAHPVPAHLRPQLIRWICAGMCPSSLLQAVLTNDLNRAAMLCGTDDWAEVTSIIGFLRAAAPPGCWGTPAVLQTWPSHIHPAVAK